MSREENLNLEGDRGPDWRGSRSSHSDSGAEPFGGSDLSQQSGGSVIRRSSEDSFGSGPVESSQEANGETPGRPDQSISEYAEAYARMMEDRESGVRMQNSVMTPQPESRFSEESAENHSRSSSPSHASSSPPVASSSVPQHHPLHYTPAVRPVISATSSTAQETPIGFFPHGPSANQPQASSSAPPFPDSSHQRTYTSSSANSSRAAAPSNSHRRKQSQGGDPQLEDELFASHEGDLVPRGNFARPSRSTGPAMGRYGPRISHPQNPQLPPQPTHKRVPSISMRSKVSSSVSNNSNGSDSPQGSMMRSSANRLSNSVRIPPYSGGQFPHNSPGLTSSSNLKSEKAKATATLHYLSRRIHWFRAVSFLMLIFAVSMSLGSYISVTRMLAKAQNNRSVGCASLHKGDSPSSPAVSSPTAETCLFFFHDMTAFMTLTGLWIIATTILGITNVATGYMFYWRKLTRFTMVYNLTMFVVTVIVLNWSIILLSFSYEKGNYRQAEGKIAKDASHMSGRLQVSSTVLLVSVSFFWLFSLINTLLLYQIRKYLMAKPRYCCWPAGNCCGVPGSGPFSGKNPIHHHLNELESDPEEEIILGTEASRKKPHSNESTLSASVAPAPPPQPDLTPLLQSLQGIQSTVSMLADKVQTLEQREASKASSSYADPFAYGRQPQF